MFPKDKGFEGIFADFERLAKAMMEQAGSQGLVYGYQSVQGPDGVPHIREFTNQPACGVAKSIGPPKDDGIIEPYHDVLEQDGRLKVIVDMPGVEKKDIKVKAGAGQLCIDAKSEHRAYSKTIRLKARVCEKPKKATYRNGVLELTYDTENETKDVKVD